MKLGFIAHKVHRHGGMERASAEVLERFARQHDVVVIARECDVQAERLSWMPVYPIPRPNVLLSWSFARKARQIELGLGCTLTNAVGASAIDADVITAQFCHAAFHARCGGLRGGRNGFRRVYQGLAERLFAHQEKRAYTSPRLKKVIAVSEGVKQELMDFYGVEGQTIAVIPNAVDHSMFKPASGHEEKQSLRNALGLPQTACICLFVGGDWERKGLGDAIRAIVGLPGTVLVVVGNGNKARFSALADETGSGGRVFFVGRSLRPQDYYAAADMFVFPSRYEAFSLVTIEAAASGLPIIALRINGTEELIEHGVNGFFVDSTPQSIKEKIALLQQDATLRQAMSQAVLETSQKYTWDRVAAEQLQVFEEISK